MRGDDEQSGHLFSYLSPEQRVPTDHPLRSIRQMTDAAQAAVVDLTSGAWAVTLAWERYTQTAAPSSKPGHWGEGITAEDMTALRWVKPRIVAEVAFVEWTRDVFYGIPSSWRFALTSVRAP
jgi:hypothetical protein